MIKLIAQTLTHVLQGPIAIKKLDSLHQQEMVLEVQEAKILLSFDNAKARVSSSNPHS